MATIDLPSSLSSRVLNALKADPRTVDLRAQAPHFFSLGARMLELFEEEEMVDVLIDVSFYILERTLLADAGYQTFKQRASTISDHASNPRGALGEGVEFLRGLDEMERGCMFSSTRLPDRAC